MSDRDRSVTVDGDDRLQVTIERLHATGTLDVSLDDGRTFSLPLEEISGSFHAYRELFRDRGRAGLTAAPARGVASCHAPRTHPRGVSRPQPSDAGLTRRCATPVNQI
ncbi:MAG TPA: hypothetical protein VFH63_05060 [candidate division Zixibacteria bacterium]|nr:hypothetical protein [candidate division Zixibacteria bacterium]